MKGMHGRIRVVRRLSPLQKAQCKESEFFAESEAPRRSFCPFRACCLLLRAAKAEVNHYSFKDR